jgi:hypothetical protein
MASACVGDAPPVLAFPDVGLLRNRIDAFLLVVQARRTSRSAGQEALSAIGPHAALGIVFNDADGQGPPTKRQGGQGSARVPGEGAAPAAA